MNTFVNTQYVFTGIAVKKRETNYLKANKSILFSIGEEASFHPQMQKGKNNLKLDRSQGSQFTFIKSNSVFHAL